jgi:hypothetical protein
MESEVTVTPERYRAQSSQSPMSGSQSSLEDTDGESKAEARHKSSALAGYVGLFTGCGALLALGLFLPLPARFGRIEGVTMGQAVTYSFYVVGAISLWVAVFVAFGLRHLRGEEGKGWRLLLGLRRANPDGTGAEDDSRPKTVCVNAASHINNLILLTHVRNSYLIGTSSGNPSTWVLSIPR